MIKPQETKPTSPEELLINEVNGYLPFFVDKLRNTKWLTNVREIRIGINYDLPVIKGIAAILQKNGWECCIVEKTSFERKDSLDTHFICVKNPHFIEGTEELPEIIPQTKWYKRLFNWFIDGDPGFGD